MSKENIHVNVMDSIVKENNKKITIYMITMKVGNGLCMTLRRYNEVQSFHDKLKKSCPAEAKQLKLPNRKFFGFDIVDSRRNALRNYVISVLSDPALVNRPEVKTFFNLPPPSSSLSSSSSPCLSNADCDDDDEAYFSEASKTAYGSRCGSADSTGNPIAFTEKKSAKPTDFEFLKVLGKGSFGKVLLARHKCENNLYAVKIVSKAYVLKKNEVRHVMAERNVLLKNTKHPFLVSLKYSFQTSGRLYFVLDYVNGGELFFHLQRERTMSEEAGRFYCAEIASALSYLHYHNTIYRDLKPENILLDREGHVKLTDFGLCKENVVDRLAMSTFCGTPEYLAPEMIEKRPYDKTVDWWCLGCVLYEILFGLPPFYDKNLSIMYAGICRDPLVLPTNVNKQKMSNAVKNLLFRLLEKNNQIRLGARNDFEEIKKHPFFATTDWSMVEKRLVQPPFVPKLDSDLDLRNFDDSFTEEPLSASIIHGSLENNIPYTTATTNDNDNRYNPLLSFKRALHSNNSIFSNNNNTAITTNNNKSNSDDDDVFLGFSYVGSIGEELVCPM